MPHPPATLRVSHSGWKTKLSYPAMSNAEDRHDRYRLTSRYLLVDGSPAIPVTGELHFSRVPRERWQERLLLMRAAGLTQVSTYIFWNHHEERRGERRFDGNRDLGAFIELAAEAGLGVILRIGPWSHGEARYGGFPDWVQNSGVKLRTDDPAYLALVEEWFAALGEIAAPFCGPQGPVVSIQIENELVDRPQHIHTLKRMLRRAGMVAPLWTSSAWGSARLPGAEVLPLYGGYPDGFWMDHDAPWDDSFHSHFFFSHEWDDTALGADVRAQQGTQAEGAAVPATTVFPVVTCELGSGMVGSYHRRPWPAALDAAAISSNALGSGSSWQGYYMFAGGTNPPGLDGLQESHATGYPNDMPRFDYDFHAPIGATGRIRPSLAPLRRQHAFLAAFGQALADMPSSLPQELPAGIDDTTTLRWALRSDGTSGFVFIGWHQPEIPLAGHPGVRFQVDLEGVSVRFPSAPVAIPAGTVTHWPINLEVGGVRLTWATASPLTVLHDDLRPTLVLVADHGIPAQLAFADGSTAEATWQEANGPVFVHPAACGEARLDVLVVAEEEADRLWVLEEGGERRLLLSADPLWSHEDGHLRVRSARTPDVRRYDPGTRTFLPLTLTCEGRPPKIGEVPARLLRAPDLQPRDYGSRAGRASAPRDAHFVGGAAEWSLTLPGWLGEHGDLLELELEWAGDAAQLWVDGRPVADRFWDGSPWLVDLSALGITPDAEVILRVLPLFPDARVHLPAGARARRQAATGPLWCLDALRLVASSVWAERGR